MRSRSRFSTILVVNINIVMVKFYVLMANVHVCTFLTHYHSTLPQTLRDMDLSALTTYEPGQPQNFANFLDKAVGLV